MLAAEDEGDSRDNGARSVSGCGRAVESAEERDEREEVADRSRVQCERHSTSWSDRARQHRHERGRANSEPDRAPFARDSRRRGASPDRRIQERHACLAKRREPAATTSGSRERSGSTTCVVVDVRLREHVGAFGRCAGCSRAPVVEGSSRASRSCAEMQVPEVVDRQDTRDVMARIYRAWKKEGKTTVSRTNAAVREERRAVCRRPPRRSSRRASALSGLGATARNGRGRASSIGSGRHAACIPGVVRAGQTGARRRGCYADDREVPLLSPPWQVFVRSGRQRRRPRRTRVARDRGGRGHADRGAHRIGQNLAAFLWSSDRLLRARGRRAARATAQARRYVSP